MAAETKIKKLRGKVEVYFRSRSKQTEIEQRREKKRNLEVSIGNQIPKGNGSKGKKGKNLIK